MLGGYDPTTNTGNTPCYYIGMAATVVSVAFLPRLVRLGLRSQAWLLMVAAYSMALLILLAWITMGGVRVVGDYALDRYYKDFYMALLFMTLASDPVWRRRAVLSYMFGWGFFVCAMLYLVLTGQADAGMRTSVRGMNPNVQSMFAASGTVLVFVEAASARSVPRIAVSSVAFFAGLAALSLGNSRTALASLVIAVSFILVSSLRRRSPEASGPSRGRTIAAAIAFLVIGLWLVAKVTFLEARTAAITQRIQATISGQVGDRDALAAATLNLFLRDPEGVGLGRTLDLLGGTDPHNGYLKLLAEGGLFGGALFLAAAYAVFRNSRGWMRQSAEMAPMACLILFAVSALTGQALIEIPFWFFFSFFALPPPEPPGPVAGVADAAPARARGPRQ
jgi:O-antigen ligase